MLPRVWHAIEFLHANTLEVPIYWEQIEPQPGQFDFSLVNTLLEQAREHKVHLVLLWFATWKNGSNHYMPEWMKRDPAKYPQYLRPQWPAGRFAFAPYSGRHGSRCEGVRGRDGPPQRVPA